MAKPRKGEYHTPTSKIYLEMKNTSNPVTFASYKAILKNRGVRIKYRFKERVL